MPDPGSSIGLVGMFCHISCFLSGRTSTLIFQIFLIYILILKICHSNQKEPCCTIYFGF